MIYESDVPSTAKLSQLNTVPGSDDGHPGLSRYMPVLRRLVRDGALHVQVNAATASGKSRLVPSEVANLLSEWGKLLVLTPFTVDVTGMQAAATCPSCFRMGGKREGGQPWHCSRIVFATSGLASRWYASQGGGLWRPFSGVLFDEVNQMERDPGYAQLWESARQEAAERKLLVLGASATYSGDMKQTLSEQGAAWIECHDRPFPVEQFVMEVPTQGDLYPAVRHLVRSLLGRNLTSLVFLPGKWEIADVQAELQKAGLPQQALVPFHSELEVEELEVAKRATPHARVILATSMAETAVTIPDVDVVVDLGLSRSIESYHDLLFVEDFAASEASRKQRQGRAGRVKRGASVRVQVADQALALQPPVCSDALVRVCALEPYHQRIAVSELSMCPLPPPVVFAARQHLVDLAFLDDDLWTALTKLPLPLKEAAILLRAQRLDVGYEAAALLALKEEGRWKPKATFTVQDVLRAVAVPPQKRSCDVAGITRSRRARERFQELQRAIWLTSTADRTRCHERLALAFLVAPERLVWADKRAGQPASFLGEALHEFPDDGYFVVVLLARIYEGTKMVLRCSLFLPVTDWVKSQCELCSLRYSAKILSDSTFLKFRAEACLCLRRLGYDVKTWRCIGGVSEGDLAVHVATSGRTDLSISAPNGNRLARQNEVWEPRWLQRACGHISQAHKETSERAVVFVGSAVLCPGVANPDAYAALAPMFQAKLRDLGVPVVGECPGVTLEADGVHWCVTSRSAVENLLEALVNAARPTADFVNMPPPPLWHWRYDATLCRYYPCCKVCNKLASDGHLDSQNHWRTVGTCSSFDFAQRQHYSEHGVILRRGGQPDGVPETTPFLPAEHRLTEGLEGGSPPATVTAFAVTGDFAEVARHSGVPKNGYCWITWSSGESRCHAFTFLDGGAHRDAFAVSGLSLVFKAHRIMADRKNRNRDEWRFYSWSPVLRAFLPKVCGYFEAEISHQRIAFLLVERVAFTFHGLLWKWTQQPLNPTGLEMVRNRVLCILRTIEAAAVKGLHPHDWHKGNLGFADDLDAPCVLLDWEGNWMAEASLSYRDRMSAAVDVLCAGLKDKLACAHTYHHKGHTDAWRAYLGSTAACVAHWWAQWCAAVRRADELPSSGHWVLLAEELTTLAASPPARWVSSPSPNEGLGAPTAPTQIAPTQASSVVPTHSPTVVPTEVRGPIPTHSPTVIPTEVSWPNMVSPDDMAGTTGRVSYTATPQDREEAEMAIQVLSVKLGPPSASVQVGVEAVRGVMREIIAERRGRAHQLYKHGRPINSKSMPLGMRQAKDKFPWHRPTRPTDEGDDLSVLFSLLLAAFEQKKCFDKMDAKPNSADPDQFHSNHWKKFSEGCEPGWLQMTIPQKTKYLRSWLVTKLSLDPKLKCMLPEPGCKRRPRNDMSWRGFEISDAELDVVLAEVMEAYQLR